MNFKESQPIYVQIAERLCDEIIAGKFQADERIPGVREYAAQFEVNANTAVKSYDHLARLGIIYNKRGLGYFVAPTASRHILDMRREDFFTDTLPELFTRMRQLGITPQQLVDAWEKDTATP